jgi:hypothetical protein
MTRALRCILHVLTCCAFAVVLTAGADAQPCSAPPPGFLDGTVSIPGTDAFPFVLASHQTIFEEDCAGGQPFGAYFGPPGPYSLGPLIPGMFLVQAGQVWVSPTATYNYSFAQRAVQVEPDQRATENFTFSPGVLTGTIDLLDGVFGPNVSAASLNLPLTATGDGGDSITVVGSSPSSISYEMPLDPAQQWSLALQTQVLFLYSASDPSTSSSILATLNRPLTVSGAGAQPGPTETDLFRPPARVTMAVPMPVGSTTAFANWAGTRTGPDHPADSIDAQAFANYSTVLGTVDLQATLLPGAYAQESASGGSFDADLNFVPADIPPMSFDVDSYDVVLRTPGSPDLGGLLPAYGETCATTSTVSGVATAVRGGVASVSVGNVPVSAAAGAFQRIVLNPIGRNAVPVAATNTLGESNVQQRTVIRPFTVRGFLPSSGSLIPADQGTPPAPTSAYKAGSTVQLKVQHESCGQVVATRAEVLFAPRIASVQKIANGAPLAALAAGAPANPDGTLFRFTDGGTWVNQLSTKGWTPGTYLIVVAFADGKLYRGLIALR